MYSQKIFAKSNKMFECTLRRQQSTIEINPNPTLSQQSNISKLGILHYIFAIPFILVTFSHTIVTENKVVGIKA